MKPRTKWGTILDRYMKLRLKGSFIIEGDQRFANQLRSMLHVSKRTCLTKATVKRIGQSNCWKVTKVGYYWSPAITS